MGFRDFLRGKPDDSLSETELLFDELMRCDGYYSKEARSKSPRWQKLEASKPLDRKNFVLELIKIGDNDKYDSSNYNREGQQRWMTVIAGIRELTRKNLPFSEDDLWDFIDWVDRSQDAEIQTYPLEGLVRNLKFFCEQNEASKAVERSSISVGKKLQAGGYGQKIEKLGTELLNIFGDGSPRVKLADDVWARDAAKTLAELKPDAMNRWHALLDHCGSISATRPAANWKDDACDLMEEIPQETFEAYVVRWFGLADLAFPGERKLSQWGEMREVDPLQMDETNINMLKGLAWCCCLRPTPRLTASLAQLCVSAFRKIPGVGPRAARLGNACINSLGEIEGKESLASLAVLKVKIRNRSVANLIAKNLQTAADRAGVTPEEIEEMSVPEYGMTGIGLLEVPLGDFTARLQVEGTNKSTLKWIKKDGKEQKSVPAAVKNDFADELKDIRTTAKELMKMLPALRERIDSSYLLEKSWSYPVWVERYRDHPLTGSLARRLIWRFTKENEVLDLVFLDGVYHDSSGNVHELPSDDCDDSLCVSLWHPLFGEPDEALSWRRYLEEHLVQQPFKQAHREIYILTDAERNTGTYSNRYAAHILRQHQFNSLCLARGWKNSLRLMVDDEYPPASRLLHASELRAEFWIEGAGNNYGVDTNEMGTYLYVSTDQVRFYPIDASPNTAHASGGGYSTGWGGENLDPLDLGQVPPLVFSEVMRDVDLFVGVGSVGNDPTWIDGGTEVRHRNYWQSYSFGELSATAKTRKETLERLVPRLKIASKCRIEEKFLFVEGSLRTYKIHLGSGNILMEPNDQYLCIVPKQSVVSKASDTLYLPFEGDTTLSIILSKAFLLADDGKIKDQTILNQIKR